MVMRSLLLLLTIPLAVGILFPLGALVGEAFSGTTPAGDVLGMLLSRPMLRAVGNTLWVGGLTALLSTILGGILAYTMTMTKAPGRKALGLLFMVPLLAPSFMPAMGLVYLFGNYGLLFPTSLYGVPGLLAGGVLFTLPHTTLQLSLAFRTLDQRLLDAALLLESGAARRFRTVLLPHLRDALVNALLIAFVLTVTDFGVPKLLGGNVPMLATEIYKYAIGLADFQRAALLSFWLMVPSLLAFGAYTLLSRRKEERAPPQALRIEPNRGRDVFFGGLSWFIVAGMLASIGAVVLASFVKAWPYDRAWTLEAYSLTSLSYGFAPVLNSRLLDGRLGRPSRLGDERSHDAPRSVCAARGRPLSCGGTPPHGRSGHDSGPGICHESERLGDFFGRMGEPPARSLQHARAPLYGGIPDAQHKSQGASRHL